MKNKKTKNIGISVENPKLNGTITNNVGFDINMHIIDLIHQRSIAFDEALKYRLLAEDLLKALEQQKRAWQWYKTGCTSAGFKKLLTNQEIIEDAIKKQNMAKKAIARYKAVIKEDT
jgi:hypothetical protein